MEDARRQPARDRPAGTGPLPGRVRGNTGSGNREPAGAGQFLRRRGVPSAWRLRAGEQVGVVAVSRDRNALVIRDLLAEAATGRVGISPEYDDALDTSRALAIAAVARRCLPPGSTGVASIDDDWAAALVAGAPEISARVVRRLLGQVAALPPAERDILLTTLRAWLECGGNASAAARQLYCHRNTVRNRLHRLEALSGQSLSDPRGVAGLSIAAQGARLLEQDLMHLRHAPPQQPTATAVPSAKARSKILPGREPRRRPRRERR